ncbi:FAD-binding domain-containing protein [Sphingomonas sp. TDK1]|uniref:FAD-binding domain-containing protein n=1 Tax=Sphingomonas sp. TDK1 TaxID=453247 RepID=UPI001E5B3EB2|nr:FAD-binding domain-containing protein [Sphingomonas sp. TDK1]
MIERHGREAASKFLSELFWRTYWKGWLEQRPSVWADWRHACQMLHEAGAPAGYAAAIEGRTGIDAFDGWVRELCETGYLHNWARMQLASIWIFTLGLPWELGAEFTFAKLLDADPASNTLSWRWVAGLHTAGKAYLANAENINVRTGGRFRPDGLAMVADVPRGTEAPERSALRMPTDPSQRPALLLLTPEDLSLETEGPLQRLDVRRVVACRAHCQRPADIAAVADGLQRAAAHWRVGSVWLDDLDAVAALARESGCEQVVTGYAAVGPVRDSFRKMAQCEGVHFTEHRRAWDARAWPQCGKGYFAFAKHIAELLTAAGM